LLEAGDNRLLINSLVITAVYVL